MTSPTSFFTYSDSYQVMNFTCPKALLRVIDVHPSFTGLQVRSRSMFLPTSKKTSIKPMMMLANKTELQTNVFEPAGQTEVSELDSGRMVDDGLFRQKIKIKIYEVAPDATPTMETIMNHLQETACNQYKKLGISIDGFGTTPEMAKRNLFWVTVKMQVVVDRYPIWGDVVTIDTWKVALGRIGMCSNWTFSDSKTGEVLIRASSNLVLVNKETRKLTKFPDEIRAELEPYFLKTSPIAKHDPIKWSKQDETTTVGQSIRTTWWDLDVNQHVNNVKHSGWILESVPKAIIKNYELVSMALEYCHECKEDSLIQSHTSIVADEDINGVDYNNLVCDHALLLDNATGSTEITKGRTRWRRKYGKVSKYNNVGSSPNGNGGV